MILIPYFKLNTTLYFTDSQLDYLIPQKHLNILMSNTCSSHFVINIIMIHISAWETLLMTSQVKSCKGFPFDRRDFTNLTFPLWLYESKNILACCCWWTQTQRRREVLSLSLCFFFRGNLQEGGLCWAKWTKLRRDWTVSPLTQMFFSEAFTIYAIIYSQCTR